MLSSLFGYYFLTCILVYWVLFFKQFLGEQQFPKTLEEWTSVEHTNFVLVVGWPYFLVIFFKNLFSKNEQTSS